MPSQRTHLLILILSIIVASLIHVQSIAAQDDPSTPETATSDAEVQISLRPSDGSDGDRFNAELEAGASVELTAVIQSFGAEAIELRTYTTDVAPMANGGLGVRELDSEQHEPTTWMTYPTETYTLGAEESVDKSFTISVPDGTPPGQYVNALILETVNPLDAGEGSAFEQYFRKVVSVYITVPGPLEPGFGFGDPLVSVQGTAGLLELPLSNTGNVRIDLVGSMTLTDETGQTILESPQRLGPVYGGQETVIQFYMPVLPPEGTYMVSAEFTDATSGITESFATRPVDVPAVATEADPIAFENVVIEANADPIQFATVAVDIAIADTSFQSSRLTMSVNRNGELVEDFVLAENLALGQGVTAVQQRYLPLTGWESGTYTFSLRLESVDPNTGAASEILSQADVATIEVA